MFKLPRLFFLSLLLISLPVIARSGDDTDIGLNLSYDADKQLIENLNLSAGAEVRFKTNGVGFERTTATAGLDYAFWKKRVKVGAFYEFIYRYNNNYFFDPRHRYYFNLSLRETFGRFTLLWRGRAQGTYRQENRGQYKINPKYVLRNKFEVEYSIWGKPWKPYVSAELFTELNNPMGNDLTRVRTESGAEYRINRTNYLTLYLRWDEYLVNNTPRVISLGAAYKMKF